MAQKRIHLQLGDQKTPRISQKSTTEMMTKYDIVGSYFDKSGYLSHSSLQQFMKSPRHFIEYKQRKKERTDAMVFGDLFHCMVLEGEEEVDKRFLMIPTDAPKRPSITQVNAAKPSAKTVEQIAYWKDLEKKAGKRDLIKSEDFAKAKRMKEAVYENEAARFVLDQINETEKGCEWNAFGYKWRGFLDGIGEKIVLDLKTIYDATPRLIRNKILYEGYKHQGAHYTKGAGFSDHQYYVVAIDPKLHVTTLEIKKTTILAAWEEIDFVVGMFNKCLAFDEWNKSFDFWANHGIYEV